MLKFYRIVAAVVAVGLAACQPDITNSNDTTVIVHGDTTIVDTGGKIDTIIRIDTTHTGGPTGTVDSIKMTLMSYHGSIGDILTPTVTVFTTGTISNAFRCGSDNAAVVTGGTVQMSDGVHAQFKLISTSPLNGVGAAQVWCESLEAHTFPDSTQDRLRAAAQIYVKPKS